MKVYTDMDWGDFEFWSGAKTTVDILTEEEMDTLWDELAEISPEGMNATEVNDFFWFDTDTIADWLGYPDFETLYEERTK